MGGGRATLYHPAPLLGVRDIAMVRFHSVWTLDFSYNAIGSMSTLFFSTEPVIDYDSALKSDTKLYARYFWEMLKRNIYLAPSQFEASFVSVVHTKDDIDSFLRANYEALKAISQ